MTDGETLLQAVETAPDDDAPRLVYADWLEEHGDPARAEFIRIECALEGMPLDAPERPAMEDRRDDLLAEHEERWLGPPPASLLEWTWRRGFVDSLTLLDEVSLEPCAALLDRHLVREATFRCDGRTALTLTWSARHARLARVGLHVHEEEGGPFFAGLQGVEEFPPITGLTFSSNYPIHPADMAALERLPFSASLKQLAVIQYVTAEQLTRLVSAPSLAGLTALLVSDYRPLSASDLAPLTAHRHAERWTELGLGTVTAEGVRTLARCDRLRRLRFGWHDNRLPAPPLDLPPELTELYVTDWAGANSSLLRALAQARGLEQLQKLTVSFWRRGARLARPNLEALGAILARLRGPALHLELRSSSGRFLERLARVPHLDRLATLEVEARTIIESDLQALAGFPLTGLRRLVLRGVQLTPDGAQALAGAPALVRLRELELSGIGIAPRKLQTLLGSPPLRRLERLELWMDLGAREAAVLAAWPGLSRLRALGLHPGPELRPLLHSPNLRSLARLKLGVRFEAYTRSSEKDVHSLRARFGCRLEGAR
ncbi:MAG: TIGR02996 domain-containing protein [Gemmataceae bacterium]|nr:TIGR02996 domain-containing protein [Gemmataceae bacterium]